MRNILKAHDQTIDAMVAAFEQQLGPVLDRAQAIALKQLGRKLTLSPDGTIARTAANLRTLRQLDTIFESAMDRAGYGALVKAYTAQFADRLPDFIDVMDRLTAKAGLPDVRFGTADTDFFAAQSMSARAQLASIVDTAGALAKRKALFSVGGLSFGDLTAELRKQFGAAQAQAVTLADTSVMMFYRSVAGRQFELIQGELPKMVLKFRYAGPEDALTRPFCDHTLMLKDSVTREDIDQMDNGQGLPVWTCCGGYRCRHQWILDTSKLEKKLQ